jgi:hypothetical protein
MDEMDMTSCVDNEARTIDKRVTSDETGRAIDIINKYINAKYAVSHNICEKRRNINKYIDYTINKDTTVYSNDMAQRFECNYLDTSSDILKEKLSPDTRVKIYYGSSFDNRKRLMVKNNDWQPNYVHSDNAIYICKTCDGYTSVVQSKICSVTGFEYILNILSEYFEHNIDVVEC